jgi:hypothetical protein
VEKSLRLSIRLLDAELGSLGMREALCRLGIGVFALDGLGRVVFTNATGQAFLGDGLEIVNKRLRAAPPSVRPRIELAIATALRGDAQAPIAAPKALLIQRTRAVRPLTIYVLPVCTCFGADTCAPDPCSRYRVGNRSAG